MHWDSDTSFSAGLKLSLLHRIFSFSHGCYVSRYLVTEKKENSLDFSRQAWLIFFGQTRPTGGTKTPLEKVPDMTSTGKPHIAKETALSPQHPAGESKVNVKPVGRFLGKNCQQNGWNINLWWRPGWRCSPGSHTPTACSISQVTGCAAGWDSLAWGGGHPEGRLAHRWPRRRCSDRACRRRAERPGPPGKPRRLAHSPALPHLKWTNRTEAVLPSPPTQTRVGMWKS